MHVSELVWPQGCMCLKEMLLVLVLSLLVLLLLLLLLCCFTCDIRYCQIFSAEPPKLRDWVWGAWCLSE